jgi:threonylcarbamoyladenosine tRNA methylthiotransferase MtaB
MPHLHLSLQAGDDLILKRMKRRHARADAIAFCEQVRRLRPDVALGADLIAGFPTETEAHFGNTLSLVDDCGLVMLHVFPYSARRGTPAARMPQVDRSIAKERAARLRHKGEAALREWLDRQVGGETDVFVERAASPASFIGRTPQFAEVVLTSAAAPASAGETVRARLRGHNGRQLVAEALT